jgi:nudix-type nucleoside diphosphatase (YffH/AdpP family)
MKENKITTLSRTILYKGWSALSSYKILYQRDNGELELQTREIYNSGDGAAVLLYNPQEKKIILIKQFRLPVYLNSETDGFILECCAGLLDNQNPEKTIINEVYEETGYRIANVKKIYEAFATPGAHMEKIHYFVATYTAAMKAGEGGGKQEEQEEIEILEFDYNQIPDLLREGKIIDSKTIILLQWAWLNLQDNT